MTDHVTLDSNILVYFVDTFRPERQTLAISVVERAGRLRGRLGLQAIGEFYRAATGKLKVPPAFARARAGEFLTVFDTFPHSLLALERGLDEAAAGRFSFWDAVLLASAEEAGCTVMLSEDMYEGAKLGNIVVRNPFGADGLSDAAREALGL